MPEDAFETIDQLLRSGDGAGTFRFLIERFRGAGDYRALFEARLMSKRLEMGLPLFQLRDLSGLPGEVQEAYGNAVTAVAREVGELFLADGDLVSAWPYLRATGDTARMAEAIEQVQAGEHSDPIIEIAFQEGVHPSKGLDLILQKYGICQALSALGMAAVPKDREKCIGLLARHIHAEILERIGRAIEQAEGAAAAGTTIAERIAGREWLFGEYNSYVDTSHLVSILQYSPEVADRELLLLFHDLCIYGKNLSPQFRVQGQPPFEDVYEDFDHYVLALAGESPDEHLEYFRRKAAHADPERAGTLQAQLLVKLLVSLGRPEEALAAALEYFPEARANELACPPAMELCHLAKSFDRMRGLARERGDLLNYVAANLEGGLHGNPV